MMMNDTMNTMNETTNEITNVLALFRKAKLSRIKSTHAVVDVVGFADPVGGGPDRDEIDFCELKVDYIITTNRHGQEIILVEDYKIVYGQFTNGIRLFASEYPDLGEKVNREVAKEAIIKFFDDMKAIIIFEDEQ
jgi:hypothetical protein